MKKLGFALMLVAIVAFVAVGSAAARSASGSGSSVAASPSDSHSSSQSDDHGSGKGSDDSSGRGDDGGQREPGEDVRGNCDEAEHANDAGCLGTQTRTNSSSTSTSSNGQSNSSSGLAASTVTAGKKLVASVGPGYSITLKTRAGAAVKTLRAGTYTIVVRDRSPEHNFHLSGHAVNKATSPGSVSTSTWRVRFVSGTYSFACDPHADMMRGSVRVV
jgi:plastocyanin